MRKIVEQLTRWMGGRPQGPSPLVTVLVACMILQPIAPVGADSGGGRSRAPADERAESTGRSMAEMLTDARFRRAGTRHVLKGRNGVKIATSLGRWQARGIDVRGATVQATSPWGEKLDVEMLLDDGGILAVFNRQIEVFTTFDADRNPLEVRATVDGTTTTTFVGNRARRFAGGAPIPPDLDIEAYQAIAVALENQLSPAFLTALRNVDRPAEEAGCALELAYCIGAIATWVIDTALLPGACLVGGIPTFGISCALAVIGHELASAGIISSCTNYAECREENNRPIQPNESTPIILDMDGRGFRLTGLDDPVFFDLTADGKVDRVSWTEGGGGEAFLALDRNGNGRIDDGSELFGSGTPLVDGVIADNGFGALSEFDLRTLGGNENGTIDARDRVFGRLLLWTDRNHDGVSQAGELRGLAESGVVSMSLDFKLDERRDRHGNLFVYNSKAMVRVRHQVLRRAMSDVYLQVGQ